MISLLTAIVDTIKSLLLFVIHSFDSLINLFLHIPTYVSFLTSSISNLPSIIIPFAMATISVYVIFLVLNRGK